MLIKARSSSWVTLAAMFLTRMSVLERRSAGEEAAAPEEAAAEAEAEAEAACSSASMETPWVRARG